MRMNESGIAGRVLMAVMLLSPSLALADDMPGKGTGSKQQGAEGTQDAAGNLYGAFKVPDGAKLLGQVTLNEVRQLPEISQSAKAGNIERVVGVTAMDRLYQVKGNYKKVVSFFDDEFKRMNIEPLARATTAVSTAWAVRLPDGGQTHLIVRNTQPVSFEIIQASEAAGNVRQPTGGVDEKQPGDRLMEPGNNPNNPPSTPGSPGMPGTPPGQGNTPAK